MAHLASGKPVLQPVSWRGYTLGAEGCFTLYTDNKAAAQRILQHCFAEILRLEKIFSLYDPHSELCELNRKGRLHQLTPEWQALLKAVKQAHRLSEGLFDPTVQALWQTYAQHFKQAPNATEGPSRSEIEAALSRTG